MSRVVISLLAILAITHVSSGYLYRVEVHTADYTKETSGKFFGVIEGFRNSTTWRHEMKLTPHATTLKPASFYAYAVDVPITVKSIAAFQLKYRRKNWFSRDSMGIKKVVVHPAYSPSYIADARTLTFCPSVPSLEIKTDVYYNLIRC